jgi:sugar O-acyltransferase (sialic acid O-acetyltransferase NeuD family)
MLIIGAKGFAKEVLEILVKKNEIENICFFDDVNKDIGDLLYDKFPILNSIEAAKDFFNEKGNTFTLGIGNPKLRHKLYKTFTNIGGVFTSLIDVSANIGSYEVLIGDGCNILSGVNISNSVTIGKGCIVYYNSNITHDCVISDFVEVSPSVNVLGRVKIGAFTQLGANSIILPDITIGENVIVGAGSVVTKNIPDNVVVLGAPARIIRNL